MLVVGDIDVNGTIPLPRRFAVDGVMEQLNKFRVAFNNRRLWWNSLG